MMTREEFVDRLDRWGARLENWPENSQAAAVRLIKEDSQAAAALADAQMLENLLDRVPAPSPSAALMGRIMSGAGASPQGIGGWIKSAWAQGAALLAAGAIGLMVGLVEAAEVSGEADLFAPQTIEVSAPLDGWFGEEGE